MPANLIAYFCAEYGLTHELPLYAGGLGILAGDTLKQAADDNVPLVAFGLLYRGDQMRQAISPEGWQTEENHGYDPVSMGLEHVYKNEQPLFVKVQLADQLIWLRTWKKTLSEKVVLYLLDADTDQNQPHYRSLTRQLYFGDDTYQFEQQLLLGIGSLKLLRALQLEPTVYHLNEGRPALLHWELVSKIMSAEKLDYDAAREKAIQQTVYTNHTLVLAGNKQYDQEMVRQYAEPYAAHLNISVDALLQPGLTQNGSFSVSDCALNASRKANGVSQLHTELSKQNWPEHQWVNITNGIHLPTWQAEEIRLVQPPDEIWPKHLELKQQTEEFVKTKTGYGYDPQQLVIGWARRLAGYKRLDALFRDIERLQAIVHDAQHPVQILIAGKVHQGNETGKEMLQTIIGLMQNELAGQVLFIPDYNMEVGQHLTRGVDIWLNTPEHGKEACGTSGMKAISNGVLQCTVADGWAAEVDINQIGWELDSEHIAESIYNTLEKQIVPAYYSQKKDGLYHPSLDWLEKMTKAIELAEQFNAKHMLDGYLEKLYK